MKIRLDFVTNSSSNSFICVICGAEYSGMDVSLSDAEMSECINGHVICDDHLDINDKRLMAIELIRDCLKEENHIDRIKSMTLIGLLEASDSQVLENINDIFHEYDFDYRYDFPEVGCPVCKFKKLTDYVISRYLLKKYNVSETELKKELQEKFNVFDDFRNYIK